MKEQVERILLDHKTKFSLKDKKLFESSSLAFLRICGLIICFVIAFGCETEKSKRHFSPQNVILIVLDTLRADHLSTYGYAVKTSPNLDEFSSTSTRYTKMYSSASWTLPAHASMFTGLYPYEHGARTFKVETKEKDNAHALLDKFITLAEVFQELGYNTAAIGANEIYVFNPKYNLQQGFRTFKFVGPSVTDVNREVMPWIRQNKKNPFFLFVNYMDTHRPYNISPRPGLLSRPVFPDPGATLDMLCTKVMGEAATPPPKELVQKVIDQYDTAIANLDEGLGFLFSELRSLSLFENTLIIITSDHGEYFGEHQLVAHSKDIYQEVLFVPLIVKMPYQTKGEVNETSVSPVDIPDIILTGIGLKSKIQKKHPESFPYAIGSHPIIAENYYTRLKDLFNPIWGKRFNRIRRAWFEDTYKYISSSDGQNELYDLEKDPGEKINLIHAQPGKSERLTSRLSDFLSELQSFEPQRTKEGLDESEKEAMRSLGYL